MSNEDLSKLIDGFNKLNFTNCQQFADYYEHGIGIKKDENILSKIGEHE